MEELIDMQNLSGNASTKITNENVQPESTNHSLQLHEAIQGHNKSLEKDPNDIETLLNRGACFLRARLYEEAKEDLTNAMKLEKGTRISMRAIQLLCKTFWGQKDFEGSIRLLEDILLQTPLTEQEKSMVAQMIETSKNLRFQSQTGQYDMPELILKKEQTYECAEYVGPVKITDNPGKGRGLIATEDIQKGQVVIGSKAFAIVFPDQIQHELAEVLPTLKIDDYGEQYKEDPKHKELVKIIVSVLKANPSLTKDVFNLYAGPKFERLEQEVGMYNREDAIDLGRINSICYYNGFFSATNPNPVQDPDPNEVDEIRNVNTYGLWLLPSYLNHSCVDVNCDVQKYGDFMIVRALSHINKGQELLISYIYPTKSFKERKSDLQGYGFTCKCSLCQLEENESEEIHQKRDALMKSFLEACASNLSGNITSLKSIKCQLEALRQSRPELNWTLFWVNRQIGSLLATHSHDYETAAGYFEDSYRLSNNTSMSREGIRFALKALLCYVNSHKKSKCKELANILKDAILAAYGTLDVLPAIAVREKIIPSALIKIMKENTDNLSLSWKN